MNYPLRLQLPGRRIMWIFVLIVGYSAASVIGLSAYIRPTSVSTILGAMALVSTINIENRGKHSLRFAWPAAIFALLYLTIPSKTILFASIGMAVFYMIETFMGKVSYMAVISLAAMSPIFEYATNIFSFPIRLILTSIAGKTIQSIYPETRVEGNMIVTGSSEFSVDPACMGLYMLASSILAGLILISIYQKNLSRKIDGWILTLALAGLFLLNIICNLLRIICLVYFNIMPGSLLHEVMGIICFTVYLIIPSTFFIKFLVKRLGKKALPATKASKTAISTASILQNLFLLLLILIAVAVCNNMTVNSRLPPTTLSIDGYTSTKLSDGITKLQNAKGLIYVKPIAGFYSSDHQPMICWKGSGYQFKQFKESIIASHRVYTAKLQGEKDLLYTAWWYDNGNSSTISQAEWRWNAFRYGNRYALVNITAATQQSLEQQVEKFFVAAPLRK